MENPTPTISVKISHGESLRVVSFAAQPAPTWSSLEDAIKERFDLADTVVLQYTDTDGDWITISTDAELRELWPPTQKIFYVHNTSDLPPPLKSVDDKTPETSAEREAFLDCLDSVVFSEDKPESAVEFWRHVVRIADKHCPGSLETLGWFSSKRTAAFVREVELDEEQAFYRAKANREAHNFINHPEEEEHRTSRLNDASHFPAPRMLHPEPRCPVCNIAASCHDSAENACTENPNFYPATPALGRIHHHIPGHYPTDSQYFHTNLGYPSRRAIEAMSFKTFPDDFARRPRPSFQSHDPPATIISPRVPAYSPGSISRRLEETSRYLRPPQMSGF
ncbi:hypothetical protein P7C70_g1134, partial [Phenoliferia sp. Uapishka_3]